MALNRIEAADIEGKGNVGMPDTPGLSTEEMQRKLDELSLDVIIPKFNALVASLLAETGASDIGAEDGTIQEALNALERGKADKSEVLRKGSEEAYTPVGLYDPATKKYVDETLVATGAGDMQKSVYDTNGDGVVDNASALGGNPASFYATREEAQNAKTTAETAVSDAAKAQNAAGSAQSTADAATTNLASHTANTSNPHSVTKSQVGLDKVNNNAISMSLSGTTLTISYS